MQLVIRRMGTSIISDQNDILALMVETTWRIVFFDKVFNFNSHLSTQQEIDKKSDNNGELATKYLWQDVLLR